MAFFSELLLEKIFIKIFRKNVWIPEGFYKNLFSNAMKFLFPGIPSETLAEIPLEILTGFLVGLFP